jgi:signal transduction histidine kinase
MAAVLTALAIIVPCTAWYVAGSRSAYREADSIRQRPLDEARQVSAALAQRLSGRLEGLRTEESQRPFYHYQGSYHDPTSSCQCSSITPSPLARGLADPLVKTHFQIDPNRDVTMPSLHGDEWPEIVTRDWFASQQLLLAALESAAPSCIELVDAEIPATDTTNVESEFHIEPDDPSIQLGEFAWATVDVGEKPSLVALRRVDTRSGPLVQGFLVDDDAAESWVGPAQLPVEMMPLELAQAAGAAHAAIQLPGVSWVVAADAKQAAARAMLAANQIVSGFQRSFSFGAAAAALAAGAVLLLLWQTERLARQRSRFAASAAHELRTPLASLRLYGEMLADDSLGDASRQREYGQKVADEVERLGRVVSNVLGFTRLERDFLQLNPQPGDLGLAVEEAVERMDGPMRAAGATVSFTRNGDLSAIRFDAEAIDPIVQNLIDNAEKYARDCGDRRIEVAVERGDEGATLTVRDHGPGLPEKTRDRLFRPFQRGDQPGSPAGLGLGLSLVQSLADAQGARVAASNHADGGALFRLDFPAA